MNKQEVLKVLGLADPFAGFSPVPDTKLWGWNGDRAIFGRLVKEVRPALVIEVGSWLGQSAVTMAVACAAEGLPAALVCVDTWLGSLEHWRQPDLRQHLELVNGYPTFYRRFLSNMVTSGVHGRVVPMPMPSTIAARFLKAAGVQAQLIYLDGSHDEKDMLSDLNDYWELLSPGGIIFGDDWPWESVARAVKAFCASRSGLGYRLDAINWMIRKA